MEYISSSCVNCIFSTGRQATDAELEEIGKSPRYFLTPAQRLSFVITIKN